MRSHAGTIFALLAFIAVGASAFASGPTVRPGGGLQAAPAVRTAAPLATMQSLTTGRNGYVGAVASGTIVPLSRLPRLPMKTSFNTYTPKMAKAHVRPYAANGAYFAINAASCNGALGAYYGYWNVGCTLGWQSEGMPNGDTKQDYYIVYNSTNESEASGAAAANGTYTGTSGTDHDTGNTTTPTANYELSMANAGTYVVGTYDVTKGEWVAIQYFTAGTAYSIQVYSDPFHTSENYQFEASTGTYAYIYLQNIAQSDYYVVAVNQSGVNPNCVFMAPAPTPSPYTYPSNDLCNYTSSSGVQAPGGNLSITWPLSSSYPAGSYSVEVYDLTAGQRLGEVQVSLTGSSGVVLEPYPTAAASINPSPNPIPAATNSTILAWDGGPAPGPGDQSVSGIYTTVTGVTNGTYLWTLTDPNGQVAASTTATISTTSGTNSFIFDNLSGGADTALLPPGRYPAKSWVVQLYSTTSKTVAASQAFNIVGYSTETQFNASGTLETSLALTPAACCTKSVSAGLRITNTSNSIFNGQGDNLNELEFTTGLDYTASNANGQGIFVSTSSTAACNTTCTTTATDEDGETWNVTITCSSGTFSTTGQCNVLLVPASSSTYLAPGEYVEVDGLYWYSFTGSGCGNSCQGLTSEMPQHGLAWSCVYSTKLATTCPSSDLSWAPVYFTDAASTLSGTASLKIEGSDSFSHLNDVTAGTTPWVGNHWYYSYNTQGDYNLDSPWQAANGNTLATGNYSDINFLLNNTSTTTGYSIEEFAVEFPPIVHDQAYYVAYYNNATALTACADLPAGFPTDTLCEEIPAADYIAKGGSNSFQLYITAPLQSLAFTDVVVFGKFVNGGTTQWIQLTPVSGTVTQPDEATSLDNMSLGFYSLIASDMTAYFNPNTIGTSSTTTLGLTYTNTSTSVDPNPDYVDALVLQAPSSTYTLATTGMTFSASNWAYINGSTSPYVATAGYGQFWFGLCTALYTNGTSTYGGPDQANGETTLSSTNTSRTTGYGKTGTGLGTCAKTGAIAPGGTLTITGMAFSGLSTAGSTPWKLFAHGANGGGWSAAQSVPLTISTESAEVWFNKINSVAVGTNSVPTIGSSPNSYQYAIENTSKTNDITKTLITLPGTDINGQNAYDGTTAWSISSITSGGVTITAPSGQSGGTEGCTVNSSGSNTYNPTVGGANGQIEVDCTTFAPGDTIYVNFTATNPSSESDSYLFPATVDANNAGTAWLGSDEITEQFSLGLDVVIDPSNPGSGGSTPNISCSLTCSFAGTTIDFGDPAVSSQNYYYDVVRTSIIYTGSTDAGHTITLSVQTNNNPATSGTVPSGVTNELMTQTDSIHSSTGDSITYTSYDSSNGTTSADFIAVPTASAQLLATIPETYNSKPYDIIDSFEVVLGSTNVQTAETSTITYTVVAN